MPTGERTEPRGRVLRPRGVHATAASPVAAHRVGREDAARAVWVEHYGALAGWCAALIGDTDVAHDIAAEAFSRLLGRWTSVRDPKPFLYAVAGNLARDHWRRQAHDRRLAARAAAGQLHEQPAADPWLRDLVERLPERLRMPVLLHYYADLPVAAVAAAMHRPEGTIKRLLAEGRAALLESLEDDR